MGAENKPKRRLPRAFVAGEAVLILVTTAEAPRHGIATGPVGCGGRGRRIARTCWTVRGGSVGRFSKALDSATKDSAT